MAKSHLFSPFAIRSLTLRNRVVMSPMCQYMAIEGRMQGWHFAHHGRFAAGGLAVAFVEATGVTRNGRITHGCTGIWEDGQIEGLKRVTSLYKSFGVIPGIQIGHAGRRASCERPWDGAAPIKRASGPEPAWQTVGPSALPEKDGAPVPKELSEGEINEIVEAFKAAAHRALAAGFDILEIHGAHGYLIHSFFSPVSNRRSDSYGGSLENRMRFPLMVAEALRAIWPKDKPLFYRASSVDNVPGGLPIEDTVALAKALKEHGIDVMDCSSGGMSGPATLSSARIKPGYQVPYAAAVRRGAGIPTMAVGAIIEPKQAEAILADGDADLIALGRQLMAEPHWLYRAAIELGEENPSTVLDPHYSFYLERREKVLER